MAQPAEAAAVEPAEEPPTAPVAPPLPVAAAVEPAEAAAVEPAEAAAVEPEVEPEKAEHFEAEEDEREGQTARVNAWLLASLKTSLDGMGDGGAPGSAWLRAGGLEKEEDGFSVEDDGGSV